MTPLTIASRFLEPLTHPWAVVTALAAPGEAVLWDGAGSIIRLSLKLLDLLLAL